MRVLVTGGAGFIGANFLRAAVVERPGDTFVNVDCLTYAANLESLQDIADRPNYSLARVDITDGEAVTELIQSLSPDLLVHFAAESHVDRSIAGPGAFVQTNVVGTFRLLEAARTVHGKNPLLFHHVSTDEVYGSLGPTGLFSEETPYDPSSPYSASKAASDHLVRAYHRTYGLPIKITNCSNNYGPYQFPEKLIPLMIKNAVEGQPLPVYGNGSNVRDWLFVEDHCRAIWTVIEKSAVGSTFNVGGNNEVSNLELVHKLCTLLSEETGTPKAQFTSLITFVKDRPGHDQRYAIDSSKLKDVLSWAPRESLDSGLRKTVRWYLDHRRWVDSVADGSYRDWMSTNYGER